MCLRYCRLEESVEAVRCSAGRETNGKVNNKETAGRVLCNRSAVFFYAALYLSADIRVGKWMSGYGLSTSLPILPEIYPTVPSSSAI